MASSVPRHQSRSMKEACERQVKKNRRDSVWDLDMPYPEIQSGLSIEHVALKYKDHFQYVAEIHCGNGGYFYILTKTMPLCGMGAIVAKQDSSILSKVSILTHFGAQFPNYVVPFNVKWKNRGTFMNIASKPS